MKRNLTLAIALVAAVSLLPGCGYLRTKFGSKSDAYKNSSQTRPLEVPPDLDPPNRSGSLAIPEPAASAATAASDSSVPAGSFSPTSAPPAGSSTLLGGDGLQVADTLANTWSRVGLALERSGLATIQSRDEAGRSYEIATKGRKTQSPGWLKRAVTLGMARDKTITTPVTLRVRVSGADGAAKVTVEGATTESGDSAARDVLESLRQRLS